MKILPHFSKLLRDFEDKFHNQSLNTSLVKASYLTGRSINVYQQ